MVLLRGKKKKKEQLKDSDRTLESDSRKKILIKRPAIQNRLQNGSLYCKTILLYESILFQYIYTDAFPHSWQLRIVI